MQAVKNALTNTMSYGKMRLHKRRKSMEYKKTTTPSYVNFYLIAVNVIYFLFVEWKGSTEDVECMLQWGAMFKPAIVEGKQYWR